MSRSSRMLQAYGDKTSSCHSTDLSEGSTLTNVHQSMSKVCEYVKVMGTELESGLTLHFFTFDFAVFGSGDQMVSVEVHTGDGARVSREQHHTYTGLHVPASSKKNVPFQFSSVGSIYKL